MVGLRCRVLDVRVIFLDRYRVHMQWELHRGTAGPLTNLRVRAYTMLTGLKFFKESLGRNRLSDVPHCFAVVRVGSLVDYPGGADESLLRSSISSMSSLSFCFLD